MSKSVIWAVVCSILAVSLIILVHAIVFVMIQEQAGIGFAMYLVGTSLGGLAALIPAGYWLIRFIMKSKTGVVLPSVREIRSFVKEELAL